MNSASSFYQLVVAVAILIRFKDCHAGPPFFTDDPVPPENGYWEVNYALTGTHSIDGDSLALPSADINYGLAGNTQLHVLTQAAYARGSAIHAYGVGDTEIGVKYRLTDAKGDSEDWAIGIYPIWTVPTGNKDKGLGSGASRIFLPVWVQTQREDWTFFGGAGYTLNQQSDLKNAWSAGIATLDQITSKLQLGGELYVKTAETSDASNTYGFNLGGTYAINPDYCLLFSAGRGLGISQNANLASAYLGMKVIY